MKKNSFGKGLTKGTLISLILVAIVFGREIIHDPRGWYKSDYGYITDLSGVGQLFWLPFFLFAFCFAGIRLIITVLKYVGPEGDKEGVGFHKKQELGYHIGLLGLGSLIIIALAKLIYLMWENGIVFLD
ncbi:MAG: hypothetical protein WCG60_00630 [bacterium]|jgi:hypothetical protein